MALSDTFTTLGNTIINLVNSRTEHKQNQLIAGDGIQITENSEEKNADICIHPDIEAAFQSVINKLENALLPNILLEDIANSTTTLPETPFIITTNLTEVPDYSYASGSPYEDLLLNNSYVTSADLSNLTSIGEEGLRGVLNNCDNLTSVKLNNVTSIGGHGLESAFYGCTSLTSVDLSNVTSIGGYGLQYVFQGCTNLTSAKLNNVTSISNYGLYSAFSLCTSLTSIGLDSVTIINGNGLECAFRNCTNLTSLSFPKLNSNSFGSYTNQFRLMLQGVTGCTVHFPSNLESVISSWSDVTNGFGGTNTTVLFDLPAIT